ncbi:MAG: enoyl-CoA hydratase/isomerase family protein [Promethearchaeota archaeon]
MNVNNLNLGEHVKFDVKKRFGIITLNRQEKANALTLEMLKDLKKVIDHCQQAENIRGILLTGNGNSFTTGMDMRSIDASNHEMAFEYVMAWLMLSVATTDWLLKKLIFKCQKLKREYFLVREPL